MTTNSMNVFDRNAKRTHKDRAARWTKLRRSENPKCYESIEGVLDEYDYLRDEISQRLMDRLDVRFFALSEFTRICSSFTLTGHCGESSF